MLLSGQIVEVVQTPSEAFGFVKPLTEWHAIVLTVLIAVLLVTPP